MIKLNLIFQDLTPIFMNRVFKTRFFSRWMRKTDLTEKALCDAVLEMIHGLIDADLGGGIIKKRVGIAVHVRHCTGLSVSKG